MGTDPHSDAFSGSERGPGKGTDRLAFPQMGTNPIRGLGWPRKGKGTDLIVLRRGPAPDLRSKLASAARLRHLEAMAKATEESDSLLHAGDKAPEISLDTDSGEPFKLSSLKGKNVVLYFYPKADTPGCTKESCEFRDTTKKFTKANTVIVGVSPDTTKAQLKFREKFDLPFSLLADVDHKAAEAYGVWKEKSMYGRKYMGIERTTFVIDAKGVIKKIFPKVKVDGHAEEVLAALG
jgi:thioredoxin-dependent peroxiredoxin